MREYGVVQCECGACEFDHALMQWTHESEGFARLSEPPVTTWRTVTGCSECMNRLGASNDGRPWREAMVPRAALIACIESDGCCPHGARTETDCARWTRCDNEWDDAGHDVCVECFIKAAEEGR